MEPITREEMFMATAAGEYDGEIPEPITRAELYWEKIISRIENEKLTPEEIDAAIEAYLNSHDADIVTEAELIEALGGYYNKGDIDTALDGKADVADILDVSSFIDADVDNLTNYYDKNDVDDALSGKADANHNHSGVYAPASHSHTQADVTGLDSALAGKAAASHSHDDRYYTKAEADTSLSGKSDTGHLHDDRYYTEAETDTLLAGKSNTGHTHDDRYYTESEIDTLLSGKADGSDIPDVSAFITKAVNDLTNYYTKSETYTQTEIDNMVSAIPKFAIEVVRSLPSQNISPTTVYLLTVQSGQQGNMYDEYIHVGNSWELLGTQTVDLSGYYTSAQVDALLSGLSVSGHTHDNRYYTETEIDGKVQEINSAISGKAAASHTHDDRYYTETEMDTALSGKSNTGHSHAVTDVTGLESALAGKAAATATQTALNAKQDALTAGDNVSIATVNGVPTISATDTTYPYKTNMIFDENYKTQFRSQTKGNAYAGGYISNIKVSSAGVDSAPQYGAGLAFGTSDTHGYINMNYRNDGFYVGGGSEDKLNWTSRVYTTNYKPTKSDVGLGNVANLDQSSAIKNITRSGTTFAATRLDGTTFTFTQQDNNTTYSNATSSAAGLMSAADKEKLDGINIAVVTQEQYEALNPPDSNTLYLIPEASA